MKSLLEDLWDKYQFERNRELSLEEKELLKELEEARSKIALQKENEEHFEKYFTIIGNINEKKVKAVF